jgi:acylphosphatase
LTITYPLQGETVKTRAHVIVTGKVQGVYFAQAPNASRQLDVTGWVRNLPDGSVEAVFEGDEEPVKVAVDFCHMDQRRQVETST